MYLESKIIVYKYLFVALFILLFTITTFLIIHTIKEIKYKNICIEE
jgi:hypothetical protein